MTIVLGRERTEFVACTGSDTCLQKTLCDWWNGLTSFALNAHHCYCHKLKVSECLPCSGLRSLLEKMDLLSSFTFNTPSFWRTRTLTNSYPFIECQHLHTVTLFGLITVVFTSPPLPVCDGKQSGFFWQFDLRPFSIMVVAQSLHSKFIIPTCLGFVSFTLFCKRMILVLLF